MNRTRHSGIPVVATLVALLGPCACDAPSHQTRGLDLPAEPGRLVVALTDDQLPEPIHPVTGVLAGDSVILVSDRNRIYRFRSEDGRFLGAVGRDGDGPGEFRRIAWIQWLPEQAVAVFDDRLRRITVLSPDLFTARLIDVRALNPSGSARARCITAEQEVVSVSQVGSGTNLEVGLQHGELEIGLTSSDSGTHKVLDSIPATPLWSDVTVQGGLKSWLLTPVPFFPIPAVRCWGGEVFWGDGSRPSVFRSGRGQSTVETRFPGLATSEVTETDRRRVVDSLSSMGASEMARMVEAGLRAGNPTETPFFRNFLIDGGTGTIWLLHYRQTLEGEQVWSLHPPAGASIRRVSLPGSLSVLDVRGSFVAGVWHRSDGIQEVRLYRYPAG